MGASRDRCHFRRGERVKLRTAIVSLVATLGSCPLLDLVDVPEPLCRTSDLEAETPENPGQVRVVTCESGRTLSRDRHGQVVERSWREVLACDLSLADAPQSAAARACRRTP